MSRNLLATSLLAIAAIAPMAAQASDGTITYAGLLNSNTCTIVAPASFTTTLPTLSATALGAAATTAGSTPFSVGLTACTAGVTGATMFFESGANVDVATGRLKNTGTATNVELQIRNTDGTVVDISKASGAQGALAGVIASNAGTARYAVNYYATGVATTGTVASSVTYSIIYN